MDYDETSAAVGRRPERPTNGDASGTEM